MRKRITRFCCAVLLLWLFMLSFSACTSLVEFAGRKLSGGSYRGGITVNDAAGKLYYSQAFYRGWLEFTADYIDGEGIIAITQGALRRDDTVIKGDEALGILRNRLDRIEALVSWMIQSEYERHFDSQKDFEAYWRAILMPETVGKKKRPTLFTAENAVYTDAEGYRWNSAYTALLFPTDGDPQNAELAKMRDGGALLRDFEEAALWIFFQYETRTKS